MAKTQQEAGGYAMGRITRIYGSFLFTAAGTLVNTIRDGKSHTVASVTRVSAGLYEVTFDTGFPLPELLITKRAWKSAGSATPAKACIVEIVEGSYSSTTRKFRIVCTVAADTALAAYTDPAVGDPDDGCRFDFELVGSISVAGKDPA